MEKEQIVLEYSKFKLVSIAPLVYLILLILPILIVHELGHFTMALLVGAQPVEIVIDGIGSGYTKVPIEWILQAEAFELVAFFSGGLLFESMFLAMIYGLYKPIWPALIPTFVYGLWETGRGWIISLPLEVKIEYIELCQGYISASGMLVGISAIVCIGIMLSLTYKHYKSFGRLLDIDIAYD